MINCNLEKNTQSKEETQLRETFMLSKSSSYVLTDVEKTNLSNKHTPTFEIYHILLFFF